MARVSAEAGGFATRKMGPPSKQERKMLVQEDFEKLVSIFANCAFDNMTSDSEKIREFAEIQHNSMLLLAKDYTVRVIDDGYSSIGPVCPENIVSLVLHSGASGDKTAESVADEQRTGNVSWPAENLSWTRGRTRFVVPVLLYNDNHICRLAKLSGPLEDHWKAIMEFFGDSTDYCAQVCSFMSGGIWGKDYNQAPSPEGSEQEDSSGGEQAMDVDSIPQQHGQAANTTDDLRHGQLRKEDILLLKALKAQKICDLTAEEKGDYINRHEKVDRWKNYEYAFIFKLPYPGCGFFEKCKSMDYSNDKLIDRWYQDFQNFELVLLHRVIIRFLAIDWSKYKEWDFVHLTKNYLRFLLKLVLNSSTGVLFHCINGWDRTPLFISLLRLSMWADGEIHQGLSPVEMAYLTLSYDWLLFSHDLPNRVDKSEEILFFCLHMLKHIHTEEFSIVGLTEIPIDTSGSTSGGGEEMRLNVSPNTSGSSSPPSDFSHEAPPQYFKPPSRSERGFPMPWSPYQTIPRNPILLPQNKSGEGTSTAASSLAATQAAAFGHPTGGHTAASSGGASFQDISGLVANEPGSVADTSPDMDMDVDRGLRKRRRPTGSGDESLSSTDEALSNPEILQRRGERLSEVHRLVSSAYRSILESRRNTINRASYWAGSLFSEEASGSLSQ